MEQIVIQTAVGMWDLAIKRVDGVFGTLSDQDFLAEVAPHRNRAIYLLGHLTTVNDGMIPLLRLGDRLFPALEDTFLAKADREAMLPSVLELREQWRIVNSTLAKHFAALDPGLWLERHSIVSEEDFLTSPTRNRLSILLNRTNHVSFHLGQLIFLMPPGMTRNAR